MAGLPLEHAWSNVRIRSGTWERVIALSMRIIGPRLASRQKTIGRLAPADRTAKAQVQRVTLTLLFLAILLSATGAPAKEMQLGGNHTSPKLYVKWYRENLTASFAAQV